MHKAVALLQHHVRELLSARLALRQRDIRGGWKATQPARVTLLALVYTLLFLYIGACVYILLIFGAVPSAVSLCVRVWGLPLCQL